MEWIQVLTIAGSTVGALWFLHWETQKEVKGFHAETKDFHGRLCRLEEKYIQMMEHTLNKEKNK